MPNNEQAPTRLCPECGSPLKSGRACRDDFHQMLFWENEDPARGVVHHLMVLCYHLQHPSLYSTEGLRFSRQLLAEFVDGGLTPEEARHRNRGAVGSGKRDWTITARPGDQGTYDPRPDWTITAADVVAAGPDSYVASVRVWARSVKDALHPVIAQ